MTVRPLAAGDLPALRDVIAAAELFPAEMLDGMVAPVLAAEDGADAPLCRVAGDPAAALAFAEPEPMTEGTWNLRLIAVHPDRHRTGLGRTLMAAMEAALTARRAGLLLVDTAGTADFEAARAFYSGLGYGQAAVIPEFWAPGTDKVNYVKRL